MGFVLFIHVVACILLVLAVLMQAGRGGGLTETFQSAESMFGTQTNVFMVRVTTVLAVIFLSTSLFLAYSSSKGQKSLMANQKLLATVPKAPESAKTPEPSDVQVKVEEPKPMAPELPTGTQDVPVTPVTNAEK